MTPNSAARKVILHLIYRLDTGGLERVMINCINSLQNSSIRHVVVSLTNAGTFANNLPPDVEVFCLEKKPGADLSIHLKLFKIFRTQKVNVLHTYNIATIEYHPIARLAGVKTCIHAEHGRDINDPTGANRKYKILRRLMSPFIDHFVAVSRDLKEWLINDVGIPEPKCKLVYNGINTDKFRPQSHTNQHLRFIHVARLAEIKDQKTLLQAISLLCQKDLPPFILDIIGDGPLRLTLEQQAVDLKIPNSVLCFKGDCPNVEQLLPAADVFVLSSLAEGIPMSILEAMACSLPVIATKVGGIPEIIGDNGLLVPSRNPQELADAMEFYILNQDIAKSHGIIGLSNVNHMFSEKQMVNSYLELYLSR